MTRRVKLDFLNFGLQFLLWLIFIMIPLLSGKDNAQFWNTNSLVQFGVQHCFLLALFYGNYFYLIPKVLAQKGIWIYLGFTLSFFALVIFGIPLLSFILTGGKLYYQIKWGNLVPVIQVFAVSASWKLLYDYLNQRLREKELQNAKRDAELKFLRSQINPHFLFNTLNNINSLIRSKPEQAEKSVVRLAYLMRYMLNSGELVSSSLTDEIEYIRNYIELQKIRLQPDFKLTVELPEESANLVIEPLLLVSFVENCFKHGVHGNSDDFIDIRLKISGTKLHLSTKNRQDKSSSSREIQSGIGLKNVIQRLEMCYHENYVLDVTDATDYYSVNLSINLK